MENGIKRRKKMETTARRGKEKEGREGGEERFLKYKKSKTTAQYKNRKMKTMEGENKKYIKKKIVKKRRTETRQSGITKSVIKKERKRAMGTELKV